MEALTLVRENTARQNINRKVLRRTYLGSYMPFVGVRCYGIFTDRDIAEGRVSIGPVGWRAAVPAPDDEPAKVLLAT